MTLWAKLGAGVIAALAVVGIGVYVAMPSECGSSGCGEPAPKGSCCSVEHASMVASTDTEPCCLGGTCCSAAPAVEADALAACGGGLTVRPSASAKTSKSGCCGE